MKELALQVATDPDQKFDLAIQLDDLDMALELARSSSEGGAEPKWRIVGDKALAAWRMDLAQECYEKAGDLSALLLIYSSLGDRDGMQKLANLARKSLLAQKCPTFMLTIPKWRRDRTTLHSTVSSR
jgi:coatomer subunit beta'